MGLDLGWWSYWTVVSGLASRHDRLDIREHEAERIDAGWSGVESWASCVGEGGCVRVACAVGMWSGMVVELWKWEWIG